MTTSDVVSQLNARVDAADFRMMFPGQMADELRKVVADLIRSFDISQLSREQKQAILDGVKTFYDTVVRPIDLPYVPNAVERFVDDWIWAAIESLIRSKLAL